MSVALDHAPPAGRYGPIVRLKLFDISTIWPFTEEQLDRIARTEPTLRDMLQQYRHLFDHLIFGHGEGEPRPTLRIPTPEVIETPVALAVNRIAQMVDTPPEPMPAMPAMATNRVAEIVENPLDFVVRSVEVVQPAPVMDVPPAPVTVVAPVEVAKPSFEQNEATGARLHLRTGSHRYAASAMQPHGQASAKCGQAASVGPAQASQASAVDPASALDKPQVGGG